MARPVVTDFTLAQKAELRKMIARDNAIAAVLRTPRARAASKFASYVATANENLAALSDLFAGGGSLLSEGAEIPLAVFLGSLTNAHRAWAAEDLDLPRGAARKLCDLRDTYEGLKLVGSFSARLAPLALPA